ncbi:MAG TPA: DUF2141 domain-containing protein [Pseudobdellovibrionaceae bacterium]|nr:DUF2141 domain-containing protein [Pseudobdellovibrionaceae bacterium]
MSRFFISLFLSSWVSFLQTTVFADAPLPLAENTLKIMVTNLRSSQGVIYASLYDNEEGFPTDSLKAKTRIKAEILSSQTAEFVFSDLEPGKNYALSVFHDENNNEKLDTNFLGMPKEGVGISNQAKGRFGPPKFKDAQFLFTKELSEIKLPIKYIF